MKFQLTDKQYDVLKWLIAIVLPALITFVAVVAQALSWQYTDLFLTIAVAFETFLGTVFQISNYNYNKEEE